MSWYELDGTLTRIPSTGVPGFVMMNVPPPGPIGIEPASTAAPIVRRPPDVFEAGERGLFSSFLQPLEDNAKRQIPTAAMDRVQETFMMLLPGYGKDGGGKSCFLWGS
jgi:hypothetical protein